MTRCIFYACFVQLADETRLSNRNKTIKCEYVHSLILNFLEETP